MDEAEYSDVSWVEAETISAGEGIVNGQKVKFHCALQKATNDFLSMKLWQQL